MSSVMPCEMSCQMSAASTALHYKSSDEADIA